MEAKEKSQSDRLRDNFWRLVNSTREEIEADPELNEMLLKPSNVEYVDLKGIRNGSERVYTLPQPITDFGIQFHKEDFEGLNTGERIDKINQIITAFPEIRDTYICDSCRAERSDYRSYISMSDTGKCDFCKGGGEVINYSIIELVETAGVSHEDFYSYKDESGKRFEGIRVDRERLLKRINN